MNALLHRLDIAGEAQSFTGLRLRGHFRLLPQLSRYAVVSLLALALDCAVYLSLITTGIRPMPAGIVGYSMGLLLHFVLSSAFVFNASAVDKDRIRLFGEFALSGLAGLVVTAVVIAATTDFAGLPALPAKILATGVSFLIVYSLRRGIVFAARR